MPQIFCVVPYRLRHDSRYARMASSYLARVKIFSGNDKSSWFMRCMLCAGDDSFFQRLRHLLSSITQRGHIIVDGYAQPIGFLHFQIGRKES